MRPVDAAIVCPVCDYRSKSKSEAFDHERPHLDALQAVAVAVEALLAAQEAAPVAADSLAALEARYQRIRAAWEVLRSALAALEEK